MGEKLTREDVKKIEAEIEHRKLVVRKEALEDVKTARAHGDLSENFEYKAAKQFKNQNESRIRYLEKVLKNATVIEDTSAADEVGLDNTVTIYVEEDDEEETYKLVTSIRGSSLKNYISTESPLGRAIMGKRIGERATVRVSADYSYDVIIRAIDKTTTEDGDGIRQF